MTEFIQGMFLPTPGITVFPGAHSDVKKARELFIDGTLLPQAQKLLPSSASLRSVSPLAPLLTRIHERYHYGQILSTTFGLALWQIDTLLIDLTLGRSSEAVRRTFSHEKDVVPGIVTLRRFHDALSGSSPLSMSQFLEVANGAHRLLANYWALPFREWTAQRPDASTYLPADAPTANEIVEGAARIGELSLLFTSEVAPSVELLEEWYDTRVHGEYLRVANGLISKVGDRETSQHIADQALMGPLCLCVEMPAGTVVVEDAHPSWRFPRLIASARDVILPDPAREKALHCAGDLPRAAGLTPSSRLVEDVLRGGLVGLGHTMMDITPGAIDLWDDTYRSFTLQRYVDGFDFRARYGTCYVVAEREHVEDVMAMGGLEPVLEIYQDDLLYNKAANDKYPNIMVRAYVELIKTITMQTILSGTRDLRFLRIAERSLRRFFRETDVEFGDWLSVEGMVSELLHRDAAAEFLL